MEFIWYPKCSTCIKAKKWLDAKGIEYQLRDIKENNPNKDELNEWYTMSGLPLKRFFNTSGLVYKAKNLKELLPSLSDSEALDILAEDGMLVKRPLVIHEGKVLVGFKENEWEVFDFS